jgi:hypothetical protein
MENLECDCVYEHVYQDAPCVGLEQSGDIKGGMTCKEQCDVSGDKYQNTVQQQDTPIRYGLFSKIPVSKVL